MRKTITYTSILLTSVLVVAIFITATTYTQLGVGILLYPLLVYFLFKAFPRKTLKSPVITIKLPTTKTETVKAEPVEIADIDKRAFLKLIGAAGFSFFLFSLINRKADTAFFSRAVGPTGPLTLQDTDGKKINPAERQPTDGYRISEIDDNIITFYGFTNKDGAWMIMREDTDTSSFRYTKGDTGFTDNWAQREKLKYDYFHNVF